jgi:Ca2+/Na+ antiporter
VGSGGWGSGWGGGAVSAGYSSELAARRADERAALARGLAVAVTLRRATEVLMATIGREATWPKGSNNSGVKPPGSALGGSALDGFGFGSDGFGGGVGGGFGLSDLEDEPLPSALDRLAAAVSFPLELAFSWTVPNCADPRWERYFAATFAGAIAWIGLLSFVMCDFSIRAGCVLGIPGLLMGLVFLAAGTSVPDALSSVAVGRSGMGDMAVGC